MDEGNGTDGGNGVVIGLRESANEPGENWKKRRKKIMSAEVITEDKQRKESSREVEEEEEEEEEGGQVSERERERERNSQRRMASNDDIDGIYAAEYAGFMPLGV